MWFVGVDQYVCVVVVVIGIVVDVWLVIYDQDVLFVVGQVFGEYVVCKICVYDEVIEVFGFLLFVCCVCLFGFFVCYCVW